jgi:hypothetical protein
MKVRILVSCEDFANFLDKVAKSTKLINGNVELSLTNFNEYYSVSTLTINSVSTEVNCSHFDNLKINVSIMNIRNLRNYLRSVVEQPFEIIFENGFITPILESSTPCFVYS